MQETTVIINRQKVTRYVCNRSHPHPTRTGAEECETARAAGADDAALLALFEAEVAAFNA